MQPSKPFNRLLALLHKPLSKIGLSALVVSYLLALNFTTTQDLAGSLFYGIWPAIFTLFLLSLIAILPRQLLKCVMIIFIAIASFVIFHKSKYNIIITEDIVLSAWVNDASLSLEMVSVNLCLWLLLTAVLPIIYIVSVPIKKIPLLRQAGHSILICGLSLASILGIFYVEGFEIRHKGHIRDPKVANSLSYFSPVDALYSANSARKSYKNYQDNYANLIQLSSQYHYTLSPDTQDLLVLVIVGETARGDRFSLNGYRKNTNPKLATIENLYSFTNVSSCNTITIRSLKCIFSRVTDENRSQGITESAFTDVFRTLGFTIDIYSLQGMTDIYNYLGYDKLVSKYAVLRTSTVGAKDEALLPLLEDAIKKQQGNQLVILHTLGSHQSYHDRLTTANQHFKPFCTNADVEACSPESLNNAYDNTIRATDGFIYDAIKMLANRKAVVLYVSDHGESLGENGIYYHGLPPAIAPKEQFHVPMIIWLSKPLTATPSGQAMQHQLSRLNRNAPFSHDNFFHSVLGCSGISSNDGGMDETLNLCALTSPQSTTTHMSD